MEVIRRTQVEMQRLSILPEVKIIRPKVFPDSRGFFSETYNAKEWREQIGFKEVFVQDSHSFSVHNVLRGLHSQPGMGKLVTVISGTVFDVAVDARPDSATFGKWEGVILDGKKKEAIWIPDGFLHGFQVLSEEGAHVTYKCSDVYNPATEYGITPFDEDIGIEWPNADREKCIVSDRDSAHPRILILKKE